RSRQLLYRDVVGHDACGIGGVAARDGKASHEVVQKALLALKNMEHRGGICGQSGDGAGLTLQLPQAFFKDQARRLRLDRGQPPPAEAPRAVGVVFCLESEGPRRDQARALVEEVLREGPVELLGWRPVPTRDDILPPESRASKPAIEQLLMRVQAGLG